MTDTTNARTGKNYAILRVERISTLSEMRRIEQHNTREKMSENVEPGGPPPRELLADAHVDTVVGARERMAELQLDLGQVKGAIGVEVFLGTSKGWSDTATEQMKQDWIDANLKWLGEKFGRALLSAKLHEDERTPHIHAVALAAVSKVDGVRGPKPKTEEGWERRRQEQAARTARWRWNYRDLFGQDNEHMSREQDRYHAAVAHLGLARGERRREVTDVNLDNGVVVPAAQLSRGKRADGSDRPRRNITTQQYQAAARDDRARAAEQLREADNARDAAAAITREAEEQREAAAEAMRRADEDRRAAAAELAETARLRTEQEADIARQQREVGDLRAAAAAERDAAERHRIDLDAARVAMIALRDRAATDAIAVAGKRAEADATAEQARLDAQASAAAIGAERAAIIEQRRQIEEDRRHDEALLALLVRAADDDAGLNLRLAGDSFAIGPNGLNDEDRATKAKGWSKPLMAMARSLATALDRIRTIARQLHARDRAVEMRAADAAAREATLAQNRAAHDLRVAEHQRAAVDLDRRQQEVGAQAAVVTARDAQLAEDRAAHDDRVVGHRRAIADLDRREAALAADERRVAEAATAAETQRMAAVAAQASADTILRDHRRWIDVIDTLEAQPEWVEVGPGGALVLDRNAAAAAPSLAEAFETAPPAWVVSLSVQRLDLADALQRADDRERGAAYAAERLEAMIAAAGPVLAPAQQAVATQAGQTIRRYWPRPDGVER